MGVGCLKGSKRRQQSLARYSVYEHGTDRPICIYATAQECAAVLGVSINTFYTYVMRIRQGRPPKKVDIYIDDKEDLES